MNTALASLIAAPIATFVSTLLRGFQNRAVASNNKKYAFVAGGIMNACDLLVIASVAAHASTAIVGLSAFGASFGWIAGMKIHDRINRKRRQQMKALKKVKRKQQVLKVVRKVLDKDLNRELEEQI